MIQDKKQFVLDSELLDHLADRDSAQALYDQRFDLDYLTAAEATTRSVAEFQFDHIRRYERPATVDTLEHQFPNIEFETPVTDITWLVDQFRTRYTKGEAKRVIAKLTSAIGSTEPSVLVGEAVREFSAIRERTRDGKIVLPSTEYKHVLLEYDAFVEHNSHRGVPWGFAEIDAHLLGLRKEELYFVVGRPKTGKSWSLLKSAVAAQLDGWNVVFASLELSKMEMFHRYMCMVTGTSWSEWKTGNLIPADRLKMEKKMAEINATRPPLHIIQPDRGERTVEGIAAMAKQYDADVVYIDQLSFIEFGRNIPLDQRHLGVEYVCDELKYATRHFPIMVAAQFNREADGLAEMADLSKIGLSDAVGQKGDVIMGIYASKAMRKSRVFQYGIIAARAFETKVWEVHNQLGFNSNYIITGEADVKVD